MPTASLLQLPLELVRAIISHLSLGDILSLKRSCKFLFHMVCEPDLQLYHSHMREAGLRDRPPPEGLSVRERLAALRRWESALESAWDADQTDDNDEDEEVVEDEVEDNRGGIFAGAGDSAMQRVVEIEDSDPDSRVLVVEDFYVEMHALADSRADSCGYKYLDLRSSPLQREDVRMVRHDFGQKVGLICYAFAIKKYNVFAVLIEAPWLCNNAALQLLNFHDGKPHPLTPRPIPITDKRFCMAKMRIMEDQIVIVMTHDIPRRPESWITLVGLNDLCITPINAPSRHFLDNIVVLSHNTIALVNPVDNTLELCRIDTATATLHILRTLDLPPIHNDLSLFRASSAVHSPSTIPPPAPRAALFYEDPARTITCIALHYTPAESAVSLDPGEWREPEEQARTLLVTRHSALLTLAAAAAAAAQNAQAQRARTPWRTWSSSAARVLRLAGATGASHGFGTHATSYERLFLFGKTTPAASATTDTVTTITHLDFNSHRVSRPRTTSSSRAVHGCCCAHLSGAGFNTLRGHWERGDCVGECGYEEESEVDFTVEELPYRQTRSTLLDDSDAYFGTDRIVFVRSMKVGQGNGVGFEGLVCNRVIVHSMMG